MRSRILTAILACLLGSVQLEGTTVVVVRTSKHFVVAADSLWSGFNPASPSQVQHRYSCKIAGVGHRYFVATTNEADAHQLINFALRAMETSTTIAKAAQKLAAKSDELAERTAKMVPQSTIDGCSNLSCGEGLFFGIEHGVPTMVHLDFVRSGNSRKNLKLIPHTYTCPGNCPDIPWNNFFLGQKQGIKQTKHRFVKETSDQEIARKLVGLEEKADPEDVGGPIDIMTLDAQGTHWELVQGGTCSPAESVPKKAQARRSKGR